MPVARCRICFCMDDDACVDQITGETCGWAEPDLCTFCATEIAAETARQDQALVGIYSPHQAQMVIEERRRAMAGGGL